MSTIEVIAIAFCCFLVLMMVVYVACIYRMFDRNRGVCVRICVKEKFSDWKHATEFILNVSISSLLASFSAPDHISTPK